MTLSSETMPRRKGSRNALGGAGRAWRQMLAQQRLAGLPLGAWLHHHQELRLSAGMHGQSAVECAIRLHPLVKDRLDDVERIEVLTHAYLLDVMHKTGPLYNPADRDHSAQYVVAVGLIHGKLEARDFEDPFASDPRIDRLRDKMGLAEDPRYTNGFFDPATRSSANAVQVFFNDGSTGEPSSGPGE